VVLVVLVVFVVLVVLVVFVVFVVLVVLVVDGGLFLPKNGMLTPNLTGPNEPSSFFGNKVSPKAVPNE